MPSKKSLPSRTQAAQARLRVLAGPNGSGKSTIKGELKPAWIYLYFVATDDVEINVDRVRRRVEQGGHCVPTDKVRSRYIRSIDLMTEASGVAHRAYIFDNSGSRLKLLAEVDDSQELRISTGTLPRWFVETALWRSFNG